MQIEGKVKNNSTDLVQEVQVNIMFYGSNNLLQYYKSEFANPEVLSPGMVGEFKINVDKENINKAKSYVLEISWESMNFDTGITKMLDNNTAE